MWSSIRRPGKFSKKGGNLAPKTTATSAAASAAMHAVLSGADEFQPPYIKNVLNQNTENEEKSDSRDSIPLHPLLLDGSSTHHSVRVFNANE